MTLTPEILKQLSQIAHSVTLDKDGHILNVVFNPPSKPMPQAPKRRVVAKAENRRIVRKSVVR